MVKLSRQARLQRMIFFLLLGIVAVLSLFAIAKAMGLLIPAQPAPVVEENVVHLDSLSLDQKIAQMVVVAGQKWNLGAWKKLQVGGIHLYAKANESVFRETISEFQERMVIPFFVSVDLEGCQNPFAAFKNFTAASEVSTEKDAFTKGVEEGSYLSSLGITLNFAPVVDLEDTIWKCRTYPGDVQRITSLASAYVAGVQEENVLATAKHYPGKTLVIRDPHKYLVQAEISEDDVYPFEMLSSSVKAVMVSHVISSGVINSQGVPAVASAEAVAGLRQEFGGLIITDEINMLGLKKYYPTLDQLYLAVFTAGNDLIINFNDDPHEIRRMISVVRDAVIRGEISEEKINASVQRILMAKGFRVE